MRYVYEATRSKPPKLAIPHDPDSEVFYGFTYRPKPWYADTEYLQSTDNDALGDLVTPSTPNGFYYVAISGGVSGSIEPEWPCVAGDSVVDGCVEWVTQPYDLLLKSSATITGSTWIASDDAIVLIDDGIADGETYVKVTGVPSTIGSFTLTNSMELTRFGKTEKFDHSMIIKVAQK